MALKIISWQKQIILAEMNFGDTSSGEFGFLEFAVWTYFAYQSLVRSLFFFFFVHFGFLFVWGFFCGFFCLIGWGFFVWGFFCGFGYFWFFGFFKMCLKSVFHCKKPHSGIGCRHMLSHWATFITRISGQNKNGQNLLLDTLQLLALLSVYYFCFLEAAVRSLSASNKYVHWQKILNRIIKHSLLSLLHRLIGNGH